MIYSMTGYGKAETEINGVPYEVEIKSLNSKFFDLQLRLPNNLRQKEMELRKWLEKKLLRGKIVFQINVGNAAEQSARKLNKEVLIKYFEEINESFDDLDPSEIIASLIRNPDVWIQNEDEDADSLFSELKPVMEKAVEELIQFRKQEGKEIEKDLLLQLNEIRNHLEEIKKLAPARTDRIRRKLEESIRLIREHADENRFEQELIYYLEKLDINEEISRLKNHLDYFQTTLQSGETSKGKKLNFISQEMGREINTIGSKANDAAIQRHVVQMKDALEKIKEQTANIL